MTKYDRMQDAFETYASENGDGFGGRDYAGASDYRAEGYALAEQAADMPEEDRADWIDTEAYAFPASAQYLVTAAADYRLSELTALEAKRDKWLFIAGDVVGAY